MLLAIDAGNTNTVFAVFKDGTLVRAWRLQSAAARTSDEYASFLHRLFTIENIEWSHIKDVIVSSVVPESNVHLLGFCKQYLKQDPVFVDKDMAGVTIDIDRPEDVGADRLVNAAAVIEYYQSPAVAIDFGTATTFDVIDAGGIYKGGVIAPGVNLSLNALHQAAAKLPRISVGKPDKVIGRDTVQAMRSGIYWGYVSMIEGILTRIEAEMSAKPFVLATGGLAPLFARNIPAIQSVDDNLTLKGLLQIHTRHKA